MEDYNHTDIATKARKAAKAAKKAEKRAARKKRSLPVRILRMILKIIGIILATVVAVLLAGSIYFVAANALSTSNVKEYAAQTNTDYDSGLNGVIYIPSTAYNAYQMWRDYDQTEIDRDLTYAQSANINAMRVFTSYEYWQENPTDFMAKFEDFIVRAQAHGIRVMPVLFEDCGVDNTKENREANTKETGFCVCSPCKDIQKTESRWAEVDSYVNTFMQAYGNDTRLLAIEIMNEPHLLSGNVPFAKYVLSLARSADGCVPLTMGQLTIFHNVLFAGELDIYQYHDNFPNGQWRLAGEIAIGNFFADVTGRPQWLTEWQRVRTSGGGWGSADIPESDKTPDLASLATTVQDGNCCSFFWCLMVKDAYLPTQRLNGTFNGLFYENGTVYSNADLEAIRSIGVSKGINNAA